MSDTLFDGFHDRVAAALALPTAANGDAFQARLTLATTAILAGITTSPDGFIERLILTGLVQGLSPPGTPVLWFDAQNIDGTNNSSLIDGQAIGTWTNLSSLGAAGNAVQATGGLKPTFKKVASAGKLNNLSSVLLTPTQWMQTANVATWNQPNTIWVVVNNAGGGTRTFVDGNDASNRNDLLATATWEMFAGTALSDSTIAATTGKYMAIRATFNGASSSMRINKTSTGALATPGAALLDGLSIGVGGDATSPGAGEIVEIVVYNSATADTFLDSYFDTKYGSSWPQ